MKIKVIFSALINGELDILVKVLSFDVRKVEYKEKIIIK